MSKAGLPSKRSVLRSWARTAAAIFMVQRVLVLLINSVDRHAQEIYPLAKAWLALGAKSLVHVN